MLSRAQPNSIPQRSQTRRLVIVAISRTSNPQIARARRRRCSNPRDYACRRGCARARSRIASERLAWSRATSLASEFSSRVLTPFTAYLSVCNFIVIIILTSRARVDVGRRGRWFDGSAFVGMAGAAELVTVRECPSAVAAERRGPNRGPGNRRVKIGSCVFRNDQPSDHPGHRAP